MSERKT